MLAAPGLITFENEADHEACLPEHLVSMDNAPDCIQRVTLEPVVDV